MTPTMQEQFDAQTSALNSVLALYEQAMAEYIGSGCVFAFTRACAFVESANAILQASGSHHRMQKPEFIDEN